VFVLCAEAFILFHCLKNKKNKLGNLNKARRFVCATFLILSQWGLRFNIVCSDRNVATLLKISPPFPTYSLCKQF
jgi:hypothetical protein